MPVFVMDGIILPKGFNTSAINKDSVTVKVFKPDTDAHKAFLISKYGKQAAYGVVEITKKKNNTKRRMYWLFYQHFILKTNAMKHFSNGF